MKISLLLAISLFITSIVSAQAIGDYRSVAFGAWNNLATWERYNGAGPGWVTPTGGQGYPGQLTGNAGVVTLQNGFDVDLTATVPNAIGSLVVGQIAADFAGLDFNAAGGAALTVTGDVTIVNGDIFIAPLGGAVVYSLTVGGNITVGNLTTEAFDLIEGDDVVNLTLNGTNQTISGPGGKFLNNLTLANTGTITVSTSINQVAGVLSVGAGSILSPAETAIISSDIAGGSVTGTGTLFVRALGANSLTAQYNFAPGNINVSSLAVNYAGTAAQAINTNVGTYRALLTSGAGARSVAGPLTVSTAFTIGAGTTFTPGAAVVTVGGALSIAGAVTPGTSEFVLNGAVAQTVTGALTFYDVTIANAAGVTFSANAAIANELTLTTGILSIATGTTTTIASGLPVAGTGFGATKHINTQVNILTGAQGFLRVSNLPAAPYTFPTGNGILYLPAILTPSGTADFSVNVFTGVTANGLPNGVLFTAAQLLRIVNATWVINQNSGPATDVRVEWPQLLEGVSFSLLGDAQIGLARSNAGSWGQAAGTGSQSANFAIRVGLTAFGAFGVGQVGLVLPVNLANVKAFPKDNGVQISWSNLTEKDVVKYVVERSSNGTQFSQIDQQTARSNNDARADYASFDANPLQGVNFYRVVVTELSGKVTYSNVLKVETGQGRVALSVYPNPVINHQLTIRLSNSVRGVFAIRLVNATGQQVYQSSITNPGSGITETIQLPASLKAGRYTILVTDGTTKYTQTVILE